MYKIKEFAEQVGVSVRMLHHYDKIGLLEPDRVSRTGYRLYGEKSLKRMEQILLYKELDFSLEEIKSLLKDQNDDRSFALASQKKLLILKKERLERIIALIEMMIKKDEMMAGNIKEVFSDGVLRKHKEAYAKEAKARWGDTDPYKESQKRFASYTPQQLQQIMAEQGHIYDELAALTDRSIEDPAVQEKVHEARMFISRYWYECTLEIFEGLGQIYVSDERFTQNIDKHGEGLAAFLSGAIAYYAAHTKA